jgi:hypothetical protein
LSTPRQHAQRFPRAGRNANSSTPGAEGHSEWRFQQSKAREYVRNDTAAIFHSL